MVNTLSFLPIPLLQWYGEHARDLPWRREPTPYRVWVSEIMLQQTRVAAVLGYFAKFMDAFPTVQDLAAAPEDQLMKLWQGLGYYSRARNLPKAARQIVDTFGGVFPTDYGDIRSLAGVGDYTAAAIASISFGQPVPAVDGNLLRVAARVMGDDTDITTTQGKRHFTAALQEIIPLDFPWPVQSGHDGPGGYGLPAQRGASVPAMPGGGILPGQKTGENQRPAGPPGQEAPAGGRAGGFSALSWGKGGPSTAAGQGPPGRAVGVPQRAGPGGGRHGGLGAHGRGDPWRDRGAYLYPCGMAYDGSVLAGEPGAAACGMGLGGPG